MLDDKLSDNSQVELCKQCKECKLNNDGTVWSSHYSKSYCQMYARPMRKPDNVIHNTGRCPYRSVDER